MAANDVTLIDMVRAFPRVLRARRQIDRAKRLHAENRGDDAFDLASPAFDVLTELASRGNPHASTVLLFSAVFFAELAEGLGQPGKARPAVLCAAGLCKELKPGSPKLAPGIDTYSVWYKAWLGRTETYAPGND